jgi:hypothetical protein
MTETKKATGQDGLTASERRRLKRKEPPVAARELAAQFMAMSELDTPEERERRVAALVHGVEVVGARRWHQMAKAARNAQAMAWLLGAAP